METPEIYTILTIDLNDEETRRINYKMMDAFITWFEAHLLLVTLIVIVLVVFLGKKAT